MSDFTLPLHKKLREIKNIVIHEQEYYDAARCDADMQLYW